MSNNNKRQTPSRTAPSPPPRSTFGRRPAHHPDDYYAAWTLVFAWCPWRALINLSAVCRAFRTWTVVAPGRSWYSRFIERWTPFSNSQQLVESVRRFEPASLRRDEEFWFKLFREEYSLDLLCEKLLAMARRHFVRNKSRDITREMKIDTLVFAHTAPVELSILSSLLEAHGLDREHRAGARITPYHTEDSGLQRCGDWSQLATRFSERPSYFGREDFFDELRDALLDTPLGASEIMLFSRVLDRVMDDDFRLTEVSAVICFSRVHVMVVRCVTEDHRS
eukprot:gnl/Spiro4/9756_TR5180_c0_g1_i1.p1 gnl/Spiro4/9756_TR5180_c0_g1~~gnl/Spiro4/9756_TR5180_c0_g1_i1.p1  ORF type:complete len:279 (-),score=55.90 gnl/Spiro4/9756_TR5180_c0_g1_i1:279-1115(-)